MFWVYVLRNPQGVLYKGFTQDLEKRVHQHTTDDGFRCFTHARGPWVLVYKESFSTIAEARAHEKFLKSGKGRSFLRRMLDDYPPQADG